MFKLKIEKEFSTEDLVYITSALGYVEKITKTRNLENMSFSEFEKFKSENPEKNVKIVNVIDENNTEVEENYECDNPETREQFLSRVATEKINGVIKNIIKPVELQKLQEKMLKAQEKIEKEVEQNLEKTPTVVVVE